MNDTHAFLIIAISGLMTFLLRVLPFVAFGKSERTPKFVIYLGRVLPFATMAMLVVYCLRRTDFFGNTHALPEIISSVTIVLLHVWKRNTLLSIISGTLLYMFLVQVVF